LPKKRLAGSNPVRHSLGGTMVIAIIVSTVVGFAGGMMLGYIFGRADAYTSEELKARERLREAEKRLTNG
jgi:hypothetical protein